MENAEGQLSFLWGELVWFHWGRSFSKWARICWKSFWDFKINILGKKDETIIHFCDKCKLLIRIYGWMIPCKHAFLLRLCYFTWKRGDMMCQPGNSVQQIQKHSQGSLFVCSAVQGCKRSICLRKTWNSYQLPHESWKFCFPILNLKMFIQHFVPPPTKIYDYLKKLPDKHHMNHIIPKQYFMILLPPLQRSCPSHIISHKRYSCSYSRIVCGFISTSFNEWRIGLKSLFCPNKKTKWFNNCSYSDWYKFRYLRNTTSCLCNCSPSSWITNRVNQWYWTLITLCHHSDILYHTTSSTISMSSKATSFPGHRYFSLDS